MSRLRPLALATLAVLTLFLGAAVAPAGAAPKLISPTADCQQNNGKLTHKYTVAELKHALNTMQQAARQYTTCYGAIQDQLDKINGDKPLTDTGGGSSGSGSGSGTVILIVVIVVVIGLGGAAAFWASRRNRTGDPGPKDPD